MNTEAYTLQVNANGKRIIINGFSRAAVINGIHTLRSLLVDGPTLTHTTINDYPRLGYRGLELDLASNFFGPSTVKKVIDIMAFYKLNKLVLILGADEGWRLHMVPEVPELTEVRYDSIRDTIDQHLVNCCSVPKKNTIFFTSKETIANV
jgi:hexosaminidase